MQATLFAALIVALFHIVSTQEDPRQKYERYAQECIKETGFDPKNSEGGKLEEMPEQEKCYVACLSQKDGELTNDGLNVTKVRENLSKVLRDPSSMDAMLKNLEECAKEVKVINGNLCEAAYQLLICQKKKIQP